MTEQIAPADLVTWECTYTDGTVDRESDGKLYGGIDRNKFKSFKLISPDGKKLFETFIPEGKNGNHFVYRRRISLTPVRNAIFILGWFGGPVFAIDVAGGQYRVLESGFDITDPDLYPPVPMAGEAYFEQNQGVL